MSMHTGRRKRRKLKAEINVVPYIDVMLVLLIIFMVTAPLLNLGVDIQLPQTNAKSVQVDKEPVVVSVDKDGKLYLTLDGAQRSRSSRPTLVSKVTAFVQPESAGAGAGRRRRARRLRQGLLRRWCCCSRPASPRSA